MNFDIHLYVHNHIHVATDYIYIYLMIFIYSLNIALLKATVHTGGRCGQARVGGTRPRCQLGIFPSQLAAYCLCC